MWAVAGGNIGMDRGSEFECVRRKLGSESVKTQCSKIYFSQIYFLIVIDSHTCISGVSLANMHLRGYISHRIRISLDVYLTRRAPHWMYTL